MTDVLLFQSADGGEIDFTEGVVALDQSPRTAVYISLFGGNFEDNGTTATLLEQYWANFDEPDTARHLRSRTQALLIGIPAISANVRRVEEAALLDLEWLKADFADEITVSGSIPGVNKIRLLVSIKGRDGTPYDFDFERPWGTRT